jgi:hypothetical protein
MVSPDVLQHTQLIPGNPILAEDPGDRELPGFQCRDEAQPEHQVHLMSLRGHHAAKGLSQLSGLPMVIGVQVLVHFACRTIRKNVL